MFWITVSTKQLTRDGFGPLNMRRHGSPRGAVVWYTHSNAKTRFYDVIRLPIPYAFAHYRRILWDHPVRQRPNPNLFGASIPRTRRDQDRLSLRRRRQRRQRG